ncbi:MAG: sulfite exporter TauE/SafE family protein [Acidobacteriota bacterium]
MPWLQPALFDGLAFVTVSPDRSPVLWAAVLLIVFVGSTLQAALGIGLGLLAAPLLALLAPEFVPGPLLASVLGLTLFVLLRERRAIRLRGVGWALVGRVPGTLLGAWIVTRLAKDRLEVALGSLLLLCVATSLGADRLRSRDEGGEAPEPAAHWLSLAGLFSGISGTSAGVGGPPIALVLRHYAPEAMRATMSGFFLVGVTVSLASLFAVGEMGSAELEATARLLPAVFLGALASIPARNRIDRQLAQTLVLGLSGSAALVLLLRGLGFFS